MTPTRHSASTVEFGIVHELWTCSQAVQFVLPFSTGSCGHGMANLRYHGSRNVLCCWLFLPGYSGYVRQGMAITVLDTVLDFRDLANSTNVSTNERVNTCLFCHINH